MAHRLLVQVVFTGAKVFGRAFTEAYRQAAATSTKAGASAASRARDTGISLDEACKILDVELTKTTPKQVEEKYNYLFDINSKEKGGSVYLQSKVYRALERLQAEFKVAEEAKAAAGKEGAAKGGASPN